MNLKKCIIQCWALKTMARGPYPTIIPFGLPNKSLLYDWKSLLVFLCLFFIQHVCMNKHFSIWSKWNLTIEQIYMMIIWIQFLQLTHLIRNIIFMKFLSQNRQYHFLTNWLHNIKGIDLFSLLSLFQQDMFSFFGF